MEAIDLKKSFGERLRRAVTARTRRAAGGHGQDSLSWGAAEIRRRENGPEFWNADRPLRVFQLETGYFSRRSEMKLATLDFRKRTAFPKKNNPGCGKKRWTTSSGIKK